MDEVPLPRRGILRRDVIYLVPAPRGGPKREHDPQTLEIIRRGRERLYREYLERRKRAS
jgi:hypothetical protein